MKCTACFEKASPVWAKNQSLEMNCRLRLRQTIPERENLICRIATSGIYHLYVNGIFLSYGPARAGKGSFRVDEINVTPYLQRGKNTLVIDVAGYCVDSFYIQEQPSFIQAEIAAGDEIIGYTGQPGGFEAELHPSYIRKVQRYSFQRPFLEAYRFQQPDDFLIGGICEETAALELLPPVTLLPRLVPYPAYEEAEGELVGNGTVIIQENIVPDQDRNIRNVDGIKLKGFLPGDLDFCANDEAGKMLFYRNDSNNGEEVLNRDQWNLYEFTKNTTGMLHASITCSSHTDLFFIFDEVLVDGDISLDRVDVTNVIFFELPPGEYELRAFEVYTMKYVKLVSTVGGRCRVKNLGITEYKHPPVSISLPAIESDRTLFMIAQAAIETFRQNGVDLLMDCPSRERAGWLCDSFFSARTEYVLTGESRLEHNFLENFLCEDEYRALPVGMLPMCYPADHNDGHFIVNWALWLILELEEYKIRAGDEKMPERFRSKIMQLLNYVSQFKNQDGLLENLPGWIFVEWSRANQLTEGVNYPTNMLYAASLEAAGRLYGDKRFVSQSKSIKETILKQSFKNGWFMDHAIRENGCLKLVEEATETCQYYAFFFDLATPESHKKLFDILLTDFNPRQRALGSHPEIAAANAFVGYYMRLELLMKYGYWDECRSNICDFFKSMAEKTGTLWEHKQDYASCCHGFASYVICWLQGPKKFQENLKKIHESKKNQMI